jgi:hypothetical protein
VVALTRAGRQRELWFQLELLFLFSELKDKGTIESWVEECTAKGGLCDFKIHLGDHEAVIEVKALQQSDRIRTNWTLRASAVDLVKAIPKMLSIPATSHYLLIFAYPARDESEWNGLVDYMPIKLQDVGVAGVTVSRAKVYHSPGGELSIGSIRISAQV